MISPLQQQTNEAVASLTQEQLNHVKAQLAIVAEVRKWIDERLANEPDIPRDSDDPQALIEASAYAWISTGVMQILREKVDSVGEFMGIENWASASGKEKAMLLISALDGDSGNHRVGV